MKKEEFMSDARAEKVLASVSKRAGIMRTQVQSVVQGYTPALFVFGPAGLGKTYNITSELDALCGKSWRHHTAYSTPKALMLAIAEYPEAVHVFEDCEKLYKTDVASSILRAACGGPKQLERWVTYETAHEKLNVRFSGGIIIVSNENLARNKGPLAAVASRFRPIKWDLTQEERIALILRMSKDGWRRGERTLTGAECKRVAQFLVAEMVTGTVTFPVDLRTFVEHALPAYAQCKADGKGLNWQEVIRAKLTGEVILNEGRGAKNGRLELLALSLHQNKGLTTRTRQEAWKRETGLGQAIYYAHLRKATGGKLK